MKTLPLEFLICLLSAHIIGDFLLQTSRDVKNKHRLPVLLKHGFTIGALTWLLCGIWHEWLLPFMVFLTHFLVDLAKTSLSPRFKHSPLSLFLIDQFVHLCILILLCMIFTVPVAQGFWIQHAGTFYPRLLIFASGFVLCVRTGAMVMEMAVKPYLAQTQEVRSRHVRGLKNGGRIIGQLERAMIFLFVMAGQPGAIGFLIAAKSILRFGEIKDRENLMEAEYIIIGTLMSFLTGLLISYGARYLLTELG